MLAAFLPATRSLLFGLWFGGLICILLSAELSAQSVDARAAGRLMDLRAYIEAPGESLTAEEAVQLQKRKGVVRPLENLYFGRLEQPVWFYLRIRNSRPLAQDYVLFAGPAYLGRVDLFPVNDGTVDHTNAQHTGFLLPLEERSTYHHEIIFPVTVAANSEQAYLLRVHNRGPPLRLDMSLRTAEDFADADNFESRVFLIFYGILISLIVYNGLLALATRERVYLTYVFYVLGMMSAQAMLEGHVPYVLDVPAQFKYGLRFLTAFAAFLAAVLFCNDLLTYVRTHRVLRPVSLALYGLYAVMMPLGFFLPPGLVNIMLSIFLLLGLLFVLTAGVIGVLRRDRTARIFMLAWVALFSSGVIFAVYNLGWIPGGEWVYHVVQVGVVLEAWLLSFALADRINVMKRSLESYARDLEQKIAERTSTLEKSLEDLRRHSALISYEMELAGGIQRSLLPPNSYSDARCELRAWVRPLQEVGGDFFVVLESRGRTVVALFDVSGHGVPAALLTMLARIYFTEAADKHGHPREILIHVHRLFEGALQGSGSYLTAAVIVLRDGGRVEFAGAGHRDVFVYRQASRNVERWSSGPFLLGLLDEADADSLIDYQIESLASGDRLLLYTDGVTDTQNTAGEMLPEEILERAFVGAGDQPDRALQSVVRIWEDHGAGGLCEDDCLLLWMKIH